MAMGMSPFSQQGQPNQSPSWPDTLMGMEGNRSVQRSLLSVFLISCSELMRQFVLNVMVSACLAGASLATP